MCETGEVTAIERRPAMQMRKPKRPVMREPRRKVRSESVEVVEEEGSRADDQRETSPVRKRAGRRRIAEPRFVRYARLTTPDVAGSRASTLRRDDLMRIAWTAMHSAERTP